MGPRGRPKVTKPLYSLTHYSDMSQGQPTNKKTPPPVSLSQPQRKSKAEELLSFRQELPVYSVRDVLVKEIKTNLSTVIVGETGSGTFSTFPVICCSCSMSTLLCTAFTPHLQYPLLSPRCCCLDPDFLNLYLLFVGKTTQIPQFIYNALPPANRSGVAVTQPRRIAAISVAERVAEEMGCAPVGGLVGYHVRFDRKVSENTKITFLTDGKLNG